MLLVVLVRTGWETHKYEKGNQLIGVALAGLILVGMLVVLVGALVKAVP